MYLEAVAPEDKVLTQLTQQLELLIFQLVLLLVNKMKNLK